METAQEGPRLKGQLLQARLEYLRATYSYEAITSLLQQLPEPDRWLLDDVRRHDWYPLGVLVRLDRAIARVLAPDDPEIYDKLGVASARHRTEWLGEHASLVSVHSLLSRMAEEHSRFHTFGRARYRRTGFGEGELEYADYPDIDPVYCLSALGFLRGSVELLSATNVKVEEERCQCRDDAVCLFRVRWDVSP